MYRDPFGTMWQQLGQMQRELNRVFDRWQGDGNRGGTITSYPAINVWEDVEAVHLEAELPGFELKDLEIYVTGGSQLSIKGKRQPSAPEKAQWHRQERGYGSFGRVLNLPFPVNPDKVDAKLENGVLSIELAKAESAKPRKIQVKS
jgi:HSP20 family protein